MDRIDKILRYFDPQRFIEVCEARFDTLRTQVVANLQTKTRSACETGCAARVRRGQ